MRAAYGYDVDAASLEAGLLCEDVSRTVQSQAEEADINTIVRRFGVTGVMPQGLRPPTYQDFEGIFDFQTAQNAVIAAEKAFMAVPADIRARFGNDPARFVEFCSDIKNIEEMRKLGLAVPEAVKPQAGDAPPGG